MGGFPDPGSGCRRHPNEKQLPGVCSFCLREKLSKLTNSPAVDQDSNTTAYYSSLSSSPAYSSASSFSPAKAALAPSRRRDCSDDNVTRPLGLLLNGVSNGNEELGLKKSRSVGCAPRIYRGINGNGNGNGEKKRGNGKKKSGERVGFWRRLIHSTSKKTKGVLMHSNTMKERFDDINSSSSRKL